MLYQRKQLLEAANEHSVFLFGARQTGKSTLLKTLFPNAKEFDLLDMEIKSRFEQRPWLLYSALQNEPEDCSMRYIGSFFRNTSVLCYAVRVRANFAGRVITPWAEEQFPTICIRW